MMNDNRQILNNRFIKVYDELVEQGAIIKNDRARSKTAFAKQLGTKGHIIDKYLAGERYITYEQTKKLCKHYHVSEDYMFKGIGIPFGQQKLLPTSDAQLKMILNIPFHHNILFSSVEAFSSNTISVDLLEDNQRFFIPGIHGDLVAFNINGNSMSPTIYSGDMVICSPIESQDLLKDNTVYAVVTSSAVWVKRVQRCLDRHGNWTHLKLISDNYIEFDPFLVELSEIRRLLKVERRLTGLKEL